MLQLEEADDKEWHEWQSSKPHEGVAQIYYIAQ